MSCNLKQAPCLPLDSFQQRAVEVVVATAQMDLLQAAFKRFCVPDSSGAARVKHKLRPAGKCPFLVPAPHCTEAAVQARL